MRERYKIPDTAVSDAENGFSFGYLDMPLFSKCFCLDTALITPAGKSRDPPEESRPISLKASHDKC